MAGAARLRADLTSDTDAPGWFCRIIATTPATCGPAMEVPLIVASPVSLPYDADWMDAPGAKMEMQPPTFEKEVSLSLLSLAPTVMALVALAGEYEHESPPLLFPAATTT